MAWNKELVHEAVERQRAYFQTGVTLPLKFRKEMLLRLKESVLKHQADMEKALHEDLGRSDGEAFLCDVGPVILEINEAIHGLRKWAKPERHYSGLLAFPSFTTRVYKIPYGVSLIISPFNFPFMLSLGVLTACIAAGNTAVMKASSKSKACTACLEKIIADAFPPEYCVVIDGGHDVADFCLEERFDKIFYTGSPKVGVHVMEMAAKNLTPVALELGGENGNWAIVRKDADIKDAARKIAFFKITNSGQICINVNQVAVAKEVADRFVEELKKEIVRQIGEKPLENPEYPHLIGSRAYQYCADEAKQYEDRIVFGGKGDPERYAFEPTLIYPVEETEPIANHELFCPLLPIVPFEDARIDELLAKIEKREHGLAAVVDIFDAAGLHRLQTGDGLQQLLLAAAGDARDAEDLAGIGGEAHMVELERDFGQMGGVIILTVVGIADLTADHHEADPLLGTGGVHLLAVEVADDLTVAQHGQVSALLEDLIHIVGDKDDALVLIFELMD